MAEYKREEGLPGAAADWMDRETANQYKRFPKQLQHPDFPYEYTWAFHDSEEIGPVMLAKIGKRTGLKPQDL